VERLHRITLDVFKTGRITIAKPDDFQIPGDLEIQTIGVMHGKLPILGYKIGDLCYLTDVKTLLPEDLEQIKGVKYLIVNALHHAQHPTHMNLEEALAFVEAVQPEQAWLTHLSHQMGLMTDIATLLPDHVAFAYDGLTIST
jgi:phosphoribosyl 1,2-cyclic phosphate phosphodiesterase